jgi:hypothetical protein
MCRRNDVIFDLCPWAKGGAAGELVERGFTPLFFHFLVCRRLLFR